MKKYFSLIICLILIFSLCSCSSKESEEPIQETTENISKEPYIYSHDVVSLQTNNVQIINPFKKDKLLDRYGNKLYYFSPTIGLYHTDILGSKKNILTTFETNINVIFNTETRINAISKNGKHFQNILTRDNADKIEILFVTNDWIYYQITTTDNKITYFKINLSGTCKELKQNPLKDESIKGKIYGDFFFPEILNYTENRQTRYRSRENNFYITFPKSWYGNYTVHEEKGIFIVYYKPRIDTTIQYEFFRLVRDDIKLTKTISPIPNANKYTILPSGTYNIGRYISATNVDENSFDGVLINRMIKDIPEIIYTITR